MLVKIMTTPLDLELIIGERQHILKGFNQSGQQIIGYIYPHLPLELIFAHDLAPVLLWANPQVPGAYEASLQTFCCAYSRNLFSQRMKNQFADIAAFIFPGGTCDSLQNLGDIWRARFPDDVILRLTYPVGRGEAAIEYLAREFEQLSNSLKITLGTKFSLKKYEEAVALVAEFRVAAQFITVARLLQPTVLSYLEYSKLIRQFLTAPGSQSLNQIEQMAKIAQEALRTTQRGPIAEALRYGLLNQQLRDVPFSYDKNGPRILSMGGMIDPEVFALLFENAKTDTAAENAEIVLDLLSFSFKSVFTQSPSLQGDPYKELAKALLSTPTEPTQEGLSHRLAFLDQLLGNLRIDGIILAEQSFCDPDQFETPAIIELAAKTKIPIVRLPLDPEFSDRSRIEGKLQSFLETLCEKV